MFASLLCTNIYLFVLNIDDFLSAGTSFQHCASGVWWKEFQFLICPPDAATLDGKTWPVFVPRKPLLRFCQRLSLLLFYKQKRAGIGEYGKLGPVCFCGQIWVDGLRLCQLWSPTVLQKIDSTLQTQLKGQRYTKSGTTLGLYHKMNNRPIRVLWQCLTALRCALRFVAQLIPETQKRVAPVFLKTTWVLTFSHLKILLRGMKKVLDQEPDKNVNFQGFHHGVVWECMLSWSLCLWLFTTQAFCREVTFYCYGLHC